MSVKAENKVTLKIEQINKSTRKLIIFFSISRVLLSTPFSLYNIQVNNVKAILQSFSFIFPVMNNEKKYIPLFKIFYSLVWSGFSFYKFFLPHFHIILEWNGLIYTKMLLQWNYAMYTKVVIFQSKNGFF